jgi:phosphoglycolate phosphatase
MNSALVGFGFPPHPTDSYRYFVGDGRERFVRRVLPENHLNEQTICKYLTAMQDEYSKHWADNTKPYPGVPELLGGLEKQNIPKAVLSNKPDCFTQIMVEKLLSDWSFDIVRGAEESVPIKPDPGAALEIAQALSIAPEEFVYVGDTNTDMQTACSAGMYAVGVLWGFRDADELLSNGAKRLVEKPEDILAIFDNG